jgi:hypothetical protein
MTADEAADRLDADIDGEYEEGRGDQLLRQALSAVRPNAATREQPKHDEAGQRFDQAGSPEPDQRD